MTVNALWANAIPASEQADFVPMDIDDSPCQSLLAEATVVDLHTHVHMSELYSIRQLGWSYRVARALMPHLGQIRFRPSRFKVGRVDVVFVAIYPPEWPLGHWGRYRREAEVEARVILDIADRRQDEVCVALSATDLESSRSRGRLTFVLALEGGHALGGELEALEEFYGLGVRALQPAHWIDNACARADRPWRGEGRALSGFGREAVERAVDLGMVLDVAHMSHRSLLDVLDLAEGQVIDSHTCARGLCSIRRNRTDDEIRAIAEGGGLVGITAFPPYLTPGAKRASLGRLVDHIDYAVQLVGPEHVGVGTDRCGVPQLVNELEDPRGLNGLAAALLDRGYTDKAVSGVLGGNFLRFWTNMATR